MCTFTCVWENVHVCTCGGLIDTCLPQSFSTLCIEAESVNHELNYSASLGSEVVPEIPAFASLVLGFRQPPTWLVCPWVWRITFRPSQFFNDGFAHSAVSFTTLTYS